MSVEQGDVEALEIARTLVAEGRGYGTWENRLAEALIACSAALERAERERSPASAILRAAIDFARAEKAERALAEIARLSPFVSPEDDNSIRKAPAIARSALRPSEDNQR